MTRRVFIHTLQFLIVIASLTNSSISVSRNFKLDSSWPDASVGNLPFHGSAVIEDFENNIIFLHRGSNFGAPRPVPIETGVVVVIHGTTGEVLRQWGENLFFHPHGIEAADNGDIFITDSILHQVFKFAYDPDTKLWNNTPIITLGERLIPGNDSKHFDIPADVAIEPDTENFYVADGYGNDRVVKFDRCGNYILEFFAGSSDPNVPIVPLHIVHKLTVAVRHSPNRNRALRRNVNSDDVVVIVADRDNCRIQYFFGNGTFMYEQTHEDLGIPRTFLMSVAHVDVNPAIAPYYTDAPSDFGIVYAVDFGAGGLNPLAPLVFEIAVGESNATIMSTFRSNNTDPYIRRGVAHDLTVSRDGTSVYICISNSNTLIVKRFNMEVISGAESKYISGMLFIMASLVATGSRILRQ